MIATRAGRAAMLAIGAIAATSCERPDRNDVGAPVVIVSIDTLRSDHLPAYGYADGVTPAIDAFRRDAILVARAYSPVPLTLPAHVSLLSGLLPAEHGVRDNLGYRLDPAVPLLSKVLADRGYATAGAVSAAVLRSTSGIAAGFAEWREPGDSSDGSTTRPERPGGDTLRSIEPWLREVSDRPFFLFFHLYEPHLPYRPPAPFAERFESAYDGEIAAADEVVGQLVEQLRAFGVYDRSLVVVLSDHGEGLGDHGEQEHGVFLYREALQVPLLIKLPGSRLAGTTIAAPAQLIDVVPTILAAVGVEPPPGLRGASVLELDAAAANERRLFAETYYPRLHFGWSELRSVIAGNRHFIEAPQPELYDVVDDSAERTTILEREPAVARALRAAIAELPSSIAEPELESRDTRERIAALGYLSGGGAAAGGGPLPDPKTQLAALASLETALDREESLAAARDAARTGQLGRASALLQPFVDRGDPDAMIALGTVLSDDGRQDEALPLLTRALALDANDARAHEALGLVRLRRGELRAAIGPLRRAVELDPQLANAWNLLGVALERGAGDVDGALDAWRRALEIAPDRFDVLYNLGTVAADAGRTEIARVSLERFVAEAPAEAWASELRLVRERLRSIGGAP